MGYIKISETARMLLEDNNYTLEYKVPKGDFQGKKGIGFKWEIGGYFNSLDHLLQDWVRNAPSHQNDRETALKTLQDVVDCIRSAEKHIEKLIHNHK